MSLTSVLVSLFLGVVLFFGGGLFLRNTFFKDGMSNIYEDMYCIIIGNSEKLENRQHFHQRRIPK